MEQKMMFIIAAVAVLIALYFMYMKGTGAVPIAAPITAPVSA